MLRRELEAASVATLILHDRREEHEYIAALCKWIYILTFAENNLCLTFECLLDTLERIYSAFASPTTTATAIVAKAELVSSWTIDTDLLDLIHIKRKSAVILEESHTLACSLFRKSFMLIAAHDIRSLLLIYERLLEKAEFELDLKDTAYGFVDGLLTDLSILHKLEKSFMSIHELKVKTVVYAHCKSLFMSSCHIMTLMYKTYSTVITYYITIETPFILEDVIEELAIAAYRNSVDRVV